MSIIKAIINDFKTDIKFLKEVGSGEYKFPYTLKEIIDIRPLLKDAQTWIFLMILIATLFTGIFISAKYYQGISNEEIVRAVDFVNSHCSDTTEYYQNIPIPDFTEVITEINKNKIEENITNT